MSDIKRVAINKNGQLKFVKLDEVQDYLDAGWIRGRNTPAWNKGLTKDTDPRVLKYLSYGRKLTEQQKEHLREINFGKKWTPEAIAKRTKSREGFIPSKEQREKTSLALKGHPVSAETRLKISQKVRGKSHPCPEHVKEFLSKNASSLEFQQHQRKIKAQNNSFNTSKPEQRCFDKLVSRYGLEACERNYAEDTRYPFECDVYIKPLDLFIEFNFHWTHGRHPFNPNNPQDLSLLNKLKENCGYYTSSRGKLKKNSYFVAVNVWTVRDVNKINTAKKNNLNYLCFYSEKEFDHWFQNYPV